MMGLLSSVKRRMSSRESTTGNPLQSSNDRLPLSNSGPLPSTSGSSAEGPQHALSAPQLIRHQDGESSVTNKDGDMHSSSPPSKGSGRLMITGLMRPGGNGSSSDVSPRISSSVSVGTDHSGIPTLTPVAGGDTPQASEVPFLSKTERRANDSTKTRVNASSSTSSRPTTATRSSSDNNHSTSRGSTTSSQPQPAQTSSTSSRSPTNTKPPNLRDPVIHNSLRPRDPLPLGLLSAKQAPSIFAALPPLEKTPPNELVDVFRRKLKACADVIFDWRPAAAETFLEERDAKRVTLQEIMDQIGSSRAGFIDQIVEDLIHMVALNIFRPLPPSATSASTMVLGDPEELEPVLEASWPHLTLVYEILLRFVMSGEVNPKAAKKYIDQSFILKLLDLFASEDPRERDYLKTIMHRVYGKIMALRAFIRKAIQHVFSRYIYENDSQHGVSELLEILGSIINGFAQPLKEEHKTFLQKSMIPLHKSRHIISYHQQLTYCMTQYIDKDGKLVEPIINGLLRYWPVTNTSKEVLFLNEVEEILEITPFSEFPKIMEPLFKQMALCIQSQHFQVSERVLFLWNNARIVRLINQNKNVLFPIVISALYKNTKEHWNQTVHGLTFNVCKLLAEADPHLFDQCNDENVAREKRRNKERESRKAFWTALEKHYVLVQNNSADKPLNASTSQDEEPRQIKYCDGGTWT